jgi:hypothetical protein
MFIDRRTFAAVKLASSRPSKYATDGVLIEPDGTAAAWPLSGPPLPGMAPSCLPGRRV